MGIFTALFVAVATMFSVVSTTGGSPVKIKSCDVAYITDTGIQTSQLQFTNGVTVSITNTSDKPVTSITVEGSYDKFQVTDSWTGKLLPNATVSVWKHYQQLVYTGSKAQCHVTKVTYADGTTWPSP
jgi:spore coat protein CotH